MGSIVRSCRDCAGCTCVEPWLTWLYCESAPRLGGRCGPTMPPGSPLVGDATFGSRDKLLTADTKDPGLLASVGGTVDARFDGCVGTFEGGGACGEVFPTMPLIAAASLGFEAGFSGPG